MVYFRFCIRMICLTLSLHKKISIIFLSGKYQNCTFKYSHDTEFISFSVFRSGASPPVSISPGLYHHPQSDLAIQHLCITIRDPGYQKILSLLITLKTGSADLLNPSHGYNIPIKQRIYFREIQNQTVSGFILKIHSKSH